MSDASCPQNAAISPCAPSSPNVRWKNDAPSTLDAGSSSDSDDDELVRSNDDDAAKPKGSIAIDAGAQNSIRGRKRRQRLHFDVQQLKTVFHLPLKTAADRLGICEAALKRICRRNQIYKWPYRQLTSVRRRIAELNDRRADLLSESGDERTSLTCHEAQERPTVVTSAQFDAKMQELTMEQDEIIRLALQPHHQLPGSHRPIETRTERSYVHNLRQRQQCPITNKNLSIHLHGCQSTIANLPPLDLGRVDREFPLLFLANVCESVRTYH